MSRTWDDLPRDWLVANIEMCRAHELKAFVKTAVEWGFDEPADLSNNPKRIRWLRACREKAWGMLVSGAPVPEPGVVQIEEAKPARAPRRPRPPSTRPTEIKPLVGTSPRVEQSDFFPGHRSPRPKARSGRSAGGDLCDIPAAEVDAWLQTLPAVEPV